MSDSIRRVITRLYDSNKDKIDELQSSSVANWEWNRIGGCGQATLTIMKDDPAKYIHDYLRPGANIEIWDKYQGVETLRYSGKLLRPIETIQQGSSSVTAVFYGYMIELANGQVYGVYEGLGIKAIIKDILDNYVIPYTSITYDDEDIDDPGYSVESISLNHSCQDAISFLVSLAGNYEWGVDANKKFFMKKTDTNVKDVFIIGKDALNYTEERKDDQIVNDLTIYGANGLRANVICEMSRNRYERIAQNLFETSINAQSDAFRLARSILKRNSGNRNSIKFDANRVDLFIEKTLPIGAISVCKKKLSNRPFYGTGLKYGITNQYGNMKHDQVSNVTYQFVGGGIYATVTLYDDIPNIGDLQKRNEYEIKDLQRR